MNDKPYIRLNAIGRPLLYSSDDGVYPISRWTFFKILIGFDNIIKLDAWYVRKNRSKKNIAYPKRYVTAAIGGHMVQVFEKPEFENDSQLRAASIRIATVIADNMPPWSVNDQMLDTFTGLVEGVMTKTVFVADLPNDIVDAILGSFTEEAEVQKHREMYVEALRLELPIIVKDVLRVDRRNKAR